MKVKVAKTILLLTVLFFVFFAIYMQFYDQAKNNLIIEKQLTQFSCGIYDEITLKINDNIIKAEVANDSCKRNLGLSFRKEILENVAMFFEFEDEGNYGFWMKDMNFPIDIIWIDKNMNIVHMEKSVSPNSYPEILGRDYVSMYVLELPSGYIVKNDIKVGDKVFYIKK